MPCAAAKACARRAEREPIADSSAPSTCRNSGATEFAMSPVPTIPHRTVRMVAGAYGTVAAMPSRILACVVLLLVGCGGEDNAPADPLVQDLRDGGLTLVIRHATADANVNQEERL